jgi:hypothetical protein
MASTQGRRLLAVLTYSGLRLLLLLAVWILIELVTPLRGVVSVVVALLVSGVISLFLLNRQRASMSVVVGSFFRGINERIEAAARAEDVDYPDEQPDDPASVRRSAETDAEPEPEAVQQEHQAGSLEHDDQGRTDRT